MCHQDIFYLTLVTMLLNNQRILCSIAFSKPLSKFDLSEISHIFIIEFVEGHREQLI